MAKLTTQTRLSNKQRTAPAPLATSYRSQRDNAVFDDCLDLLQVDFGNTRNFQLLSTLFVHFQYASLHIVRYACAAV
jgi:3-deoxy-D-arabino-heptulosonate 7-phosphate (DAHP) synthase